jgi:DNA polymerase-1
MDMRMHYINKWDTDFHVYDRTTGSFVERRFFELIEARQWTWPRLASGRYDLSGKTLGKQAKLHSELRPLQQLRTLIAELRLGAFLNTIGADGASRMPIMPFWTKTGRNQPQARDKAFLLSLPSWVHGVIRPPPGYAVVALDWVSQEPGIIAGLCSDPHLRADFLSGDAHMRFAIRAGLAPEHATKATHGEIRSAVKPISLGTNYGLSKHGVAASTGKPLVWAQMMLERHRAAYPVFVQWQRNLVASARFDQIIHSPLGWPMRVTAETGTRTLLNYPAQAGGSDCLRVACIAAHEAGIELIAPLHDALWFTCPIDEVEATITLASDLMMRAAEAVCGIRIPVEVGALVRWPQTLGNTWDPGAKGHAMWAEVRLLVERDELQEVKQHA